MKRIFLILISSVFLFINEIKSQALWNEYYSYTSFIDHFDGTSLDRNKWNAVNDFKRDLGLLKDTSATLTVANGNLNLRMISCPNCSAGSYQGNFAGAEIVSISTFQYGIFECRAKFSQNDGSWPAFWLIGGDGTPCPQDPPSICSESESDMFNHNAYSFNANNA